MAAELGVSAASVSRHWRVNSLKPHLVCDLMVSRDPNFAEKPEDFIWPYLSLPEHARELCCVVTPLTTKMRLRPRLTSRAAKPNQA